MAIRSGNKWMLCCLILATTCSADHQKFEYTSSYSQRPVSAVADIYGVTNSPHISGRLHFQQPSAGGPVIVRGTIKGLTPGLHGLHIHEIGNLTDDCKAAGPHFNPFSKNHGAQDSDERHVGDLGNIEAFDIDHPFTVAELYLVDFLISLSAESERGVLHRSVVVHEKADDLGLTEGEDSKKTGNSGSRVACGIITLITSSHRSSSPYV